MYRKKKISLVIPAYNEAKLIKPTLDGVPKLVDRIYVVDDKSTDNQNKVILDCAKKDKRIVLLKHDVNTGCGGAIITGYLRSSMDGYDIILVVGGDNQMPLAEAANLLDPLIDGKADYAKGNRFMLSQFKKTVSKMPRLRFFANWILTALTKICSGYYKTSDVVDGYTAISKKAIDTINWSKAWKAYGYPIDFLTRLNAYGFKVIDVPRTAIYLDGQVQSQIKGLNYFIKVSPMILRNFFWRLNFKYLYLDFHPLVFFYYFSIILIPLGLALGIYLVLDKFFLGDTHVTPSMSILTALLLVSGFQFLLFAMFFDMQEGV
ncbi:MAG: glycosyltransferase family 2 protein [Spirochaetota bacterium]